MKRAGTWSGGEGFTLIEALLATLLMSIILAALAAVTAQWLPNWNRGFARLQSDALVNLGLDRLTNDLAAVEFVSADASDKVPLFDGAELAVTFVRTTLAPNTATGLEVVRIAETSGDSGNALVRSTAPLPTGIGQSEGLTFSNPVVMIRGPFRVSFAYAGPDRVWHGTWEGRRDLPRAVKVTLRDSVTSRILGASTSTLVYAELPARCSWTKNSDDCPELGGQGSPLAGTGGTSSTPGASAPSAGANVAPTPSTAVMPGPSPIGGQ